ncbi:hypothetical protein [Agromyces sp. Marseille-Q5079]|uniref:hypothetical protein n=1 Tax=Agromyces sp. Marseille-Q5079 TaxID=3439059 RepID=UPI003D9C98AB
MRIARSLIAIVVAGTLVATGAIAPAWADGAATPTRIEDGSTFDGEGTTSDGEGTAPDGEGTTSDGEGTTSDGEPDPASDGEGLDIAITADPASVATGETVTVSFTVVNHGVFLPEGADELLVSLDWDPEEFESVGDPASGGRWAVPAAGDVGYYVYDSSRTPAPGAICLLGLVAPGADAGACSAQFRRIGDAATAGRFDVAVVTWADGVVREGPDALFPLTTDPAALVSTAVDIPTEPPDTPDNGEGFDLAIEAEPVGVPRGGEFEVTITVENFDVEPSGDADVLLVSLDWPDGALAPISDPDGSNAWRHLSDGSFDERWPEASGDQCLVEGVTVPGPDAVGTCTVRFRQLLAPPGSAVLTASIDAWAQIGEYGEEPFLEYIGIGADVRVSATAVVVPGPVDPPDDGAGFDVVIGHVPDDLRWGHEFELQVTVTNHGVQPPDEDPFEDEPMMVAVRLDWDLDAARLEADPGTDGCEFWNDWDLGDEPVAGMDFDRCYLAGLTEPGSSVTFTVPFRVAGPRPATSELEFTATVDEWAWYWGDGYDYAPINPATATHDAPIAPIYDLEVENFDYLGLGGVGSTEPAHSRYSVYSSEAQLDGWDDAELVVRLGWPEGLTLRDPPPTGCVSSGPQSLDCTIEDAHVLPGADSESDADDESQQYLAEWDLFFVLPTFQVEREALGAFTIDFVSGWTYSAPIIEIAADPGQVRPIGGFGRGVGPRAPAVVPLASPTPPGGVTMDASYTDSDSTPFAILDRVFPTETTSSVTNAVPGGDDIVVVFRVTHSPEVATVLPGAEVSVRLDWPAFLEPTVAPEECADYEDHVCMIEGLDEPGATVDITMTFPVPEDAQGAGWFEVSGEQVVLREANPDGDIEHGYPASWVEYSNARITVLADAFVTQVTLDRDRTWPGGDEVRVTVRVQWAKALPGIRSSRVFVSLDLGWDEDIADLVDPPGIAGCDPLDDGTCTLQDWTGPGDVKEVTFRLEPRTVGPLDVTATPAFVGVGVPTDTSELPLDWLTGDEASATVLDARFDVDLVLDRNPIYHGGLPMRANATLTRSPATAGGPGYDPTLPNVDAELVFEWPGSAPPAAPTHLTLATTENCAGFAVDTCVKTGLDPVDSTADTTLVFAPPPPGTAHDPLPGQVSVTVERASFDVTRYELPPLPEPPDEPDCEPSEEDCCELGTSDCPVDPLSEPIASTERVDVPEAWLGEDDEPYSLLQPVAWFSPAVANPGEVVTVFGRYFPPGETTDVKWKLQHGQAALVAFPASIVGGTLGTDVRRDVVVFRRALQGLRWAEISSPSGTFGTIESSRVLIAPRSGVAPGLVGRGG